MYPSKGDSGSISESVFYVDFLHVKSMLQYDVHFLDSLVMVWPPMWIMRPGNKDVP